MWYIRLTTDECPQVVGWGECAPLPALSCDDVPEYESLLHTLVADFASTGRIDYVRLRPYPSILMGLEIALWSHEAALNGDALRLFASPFTKGEVGIPINGLVWMGTKEEMHARIREKLEKGSRCVKLKIGAIDFADEMSLIQELRQLYAPDVLEIRVDANGAFSPEEALERITTLASYAIHSIEQPIPAGRWEEMAHLCRHSPLPIALDEELIGVNEVSEKQRLLDTIQPPYIVLKPSLHGGFMGTEEWIRLAQERGIGFWVTSALESNVGLNALAQWTAARCTTYYTDNYAAWPYQGLGTGALFENNFRGTRLSVEGNALWIEDKKQRLFRKAFEELKQEWHNDAPTMQVKTSGSTGTPQVLEVEKERMVASAKMTARFFGLTPKHRALLCLPLDYIAGKMMAIRSFVVGFDLDVVAPTSRPLQHVLTAPYFIAMTPLQVFETLLHEEDKKVLQGVCHLLIGGGEITAELEQHLSSFVKNLPATACFAVWSSYGMTETLSHIALRRLYVADASQGYVPLEGVNIQINEEGRIEVDAPALCPASLTTNDLGKWLSDGSFMIVGRVDNVVCSGGVKHQIEVLEDKLQPLPFPFAFTAIADEKLGQALVLLYVGEVAESCLKEKCMERLSAYEQPRYMVRVAALPYTETGKIARSELLKLAAKKLS